MRWLIVILCSVGFSYGITAQTNPTRQTQCDFLKNIKFRSGKDTIVIKAILHDIIEAPPRLITLKKSPRSIYKYKFGSEIVFQPENCTKKYSAPLLDAAYDNHFLNSANLGITVYLTCVVFNEYFDNNGMPDLIVINVAPKVQEHIAGQQTSNFLTNLHFKNGVDTVVLKANYRGIFKQDAGLIMNDLEKKHFLIANQYDYGIAIELPEYSKEFISPYHFKNAKEYSLLKKQPEGTIAYLTCVVFKGYYSYNEPFFIVNKFGLNNPNK
ncbi:hypothetical protein ACPPVU_20420 [Mucilaginibacter sp. McL0603]|uniref:hypothetical protein n=1 Tax=Mucilaginibacter sp. McL0603 TaxID=3415670 RepID=UPI003CF88FF4